MSDYVVSLTALIADNPLCLACIAKQMDMTTEAAETALTAVQHVVQRSLSIRWKSTVCGGCGVPGIVYFLERTERPSAEP